MIKEKFYRLFFYLFLILIVSSFAIMFYDKIENHFVFYPEKSLDVLPSEFALEFTDCYFTTPDGERLHGWFFPPEGDTPVLLFCHGNAGNISHRLENIQLLLNRGLGVFIFDYRGYGRSTGDPSEKGIYIDGKSAYNHLIQHHGILPENIVLFGRSLGACVAIELSLKNRARCIIIESAFTSIKDMAKRLFPFVIFSSLLPDHYNNFVKIRNVTMPKLFIHGQKDTLVPLSMGKELFMISPEPKDFFPIEKAGHNDTFIVGGDEYFNKLISFIERSKYQ